MAVVPLISTAGSRGETEREEGLAGEVARLERLGQVVRVELVAQRGLEREGSGVGGEVELAPRGEARGRGADQARVVALQVEVLLGAVGARIGRRVEQDPIEARALPAWREAGFDARIAIARPEEIRALGTTWASRLVFGRPRTFYELTARAV